MSTGPRKDGLHVKWEDKIMTYIQHLRKTELDAIQRRVETAYSQIIKTRMLLKTLESEMEEAKTWLVGKRVAFTWLDQDKVMTGIVVTPITDNLYVAVKVAGEAGEFTLRVPISHLRVAD